jgi:hypothetical protein
MREAMLRKMLLAIVVTLASALVVGINPLSIGQDAKKKAKGRLPAYYAGIVTEAQRERIYAIQDKYAKQIADLEAQLGTLAKQRDGEIEKLLDADQRERVKKAQEEAAAKKKKAAEDKKAVNAKSAEKAK